MGISGMPSVVQQFSSVLSSGSQFQGLGGGQSRSGGSERLRGSSSLQEFSSLWNGGSSHGVSRSASSVAGFGPVFSGQQAVRVEGQGGPTLTTIKSNIVRRASVSARSIFCCHGSWTKGGLLLAAVALIFALFYLSFTFAGFHLTERDVEYAIVMDGGSTGTRVHVYAWTREMMHGEVSLPVMAKPSMYSGPEKNDGAPALDTSRKTGESRAYKRMETEPGLDKLLHNDSGVKEAIQPLLDWAGNQIPRSAHVRTKLFFLATAGMRKLAANDAGWLLDRVWLTLKSSSFMVTREWVRIISGQEEAYYGWIALNYNHGRLGGLPEHTFGALDLGGSSLEVTFEPDNTPLASYGVNVSVGSREHHLYAFSHAGYGLNDAFDTSVSLLVERGSYSRKKGNMYVHHPCLNTGYKEPFQCSHCTIPPAHDRRKGQKTLLAVGDRGGRVVLWGKPNWAACQNLALSVINVSGPTESMGYTQCDNSPCALGRHQPEPHGQFYALAGFFVVYKFFGLTSKNSLSDLLSKGQEFCKMKWQDARASVVPQPSIDRYCFRAPYVRSLLLQGLRLREEQIIIGSGDFAWTLGAALNEAGALLPAASKGQTDSSSFFSFRHLLSMFSVYSVVFILVGAVVIVFLLFAWYRRWMPFRSWRRQYLPLFVQNNGSVSSPSGDGRMKQPHSPAPTGSSNDFHHHMFGSGSKSGDGSLSVGEFLPFTTLGSGGSAGKHHIQLGPFKPLRGKLSSRRTASREDLSMCTIVENQLMPKVTRESSPIRYTPIRHSTI